VDGATSTSSIGGDADADVEARAGSRLEVALRSAAGMSAVGRAMARSGAVLLLALAGSMAACGGEGVRSSDAGAGSAGALPSAGSGGSGAAGGGALGGGASAGGSASPGGASAGGAGGQGGGAGAAGRAGAGGGGAIGGGASSGASGGGGTAGAAGSGTITTPEMLVPTVNAFCAAARTCCAQQSDPVMLDDCESGFAAKDSISQALGRGTVTIGSADLAKCLAAYQAAATSCEEVPVLAACAGIVRGQLPEGAACYLGTECAGSGPKVCLVTGGDKSPGVCKAAPGGKAGELCSVTCRPNDVCNYTVYGQADSVVTPCLESEGVFCDYDQQPSKCQTIYALGAACQRDDQCGSAAYCDITGSNTCKKRGQLNEACGNCVSSLMCKDGKCVSPPLAVGGTCLGYSLGPY
jgi:hypothetical protein